MYCISEEINIVISSDIRLSDWLIVIILRVVPRRTVVGDIDRHFDNLAERKSSSESL